MSVRIAYLERGDRGVSLRRVRLVGATDEERWDAPASSSGVEASFELPAKWIRERLSRSRSADAISLVCLDVEGGVCAWLSAPSADRAVISAVARSGPAFAEGEDENAGSRGAALSAMEFYAPTHTDSSIEPLAEVAPDAAAATHRIAALGVSDVTARLMIDALDQLGIVVEEAASIWHAMATVWDPGAARSATPDAVVAHSAPLSAVVLVEPAGRLLWCWSRAGTLVAAGSMRLRRTRPASESTSTEEFNVMLHPEDASRLATAWLSWSMQLGVAPTRIAAVAPPIAEGALANFGQALGRAWPGAPVDLAPHEDPVGVTLRRLADRLEKTPRGESAFATSLLALSTRPGKRHRRMHLWTAGACVALGACLGLGAWRLNQAAHTARESANDWNNKWQALVKEVDPDVLRPEPGVSPVTQISDEIARRERDMLPVTPTERIMPVMQELETLSLVVGNSGLLLESLDVGSVGGPRVAVIAPSTSAAEDLLEAFKRVGGSHVSEWTASFTEQRQNETTKIRGVYSGKWDAALFRAPAGKGAP